MINCHNILEVVRQCIKYKKMFAFLFCLKESVKSYSVIVSPDMDECHRLVVTVDIELCPMLYNISHLVHNSSII